MSIREMQKRARESQTILDRVIAWRDPAAGLERMRARMMMASATGTSGGYEGGRRDRRGTKRWRPHEGSADADILPDLPDLRSRSRDLARNNSLATGAVSTVVTNVVGDGLKFKSLIDRKFLKLDDAAADAWQDAAEREWAHFCSTADFSSVQALEEIQSLVFRATLESGDAIVVRRYRKDPGDLYGTKLQVVEADRLSNPNRAADTDTTVAGVEIADGKPVAFHIADRHPGNLRLQPATWAKIPARTPEGKRVILHLFDRMRPEQTRGVPYLAPVIEDLKQLGNYSDAEVHAAVVSAMFTLAIETAADEETGDPILGERDATLDDNELKLGNGATISLAPGEKAVELNPTRPNAQFDPFVLAFSRQVGAALEIGHELLIKHFTASYSASRAALEMAWQFFSKRRTWLARNFLQVVYGWMLEEAIATGRLSAPGFFEDPLIAAAYAGADWIGPARPSLNPKMESDADKQDVEMGVKTLDQVCAERTGGDIESKTLQRGREVKMRTAAGLKDAPTPGAAASPGDPKAVDNAEKTDLETGAAT
jgi:lambda family phage portal protein